MSNAGGPAEIHELLVPFDESTTTYNNINNGAPFDESIIGPWVADAPGTETESKSDRLHTVDVTESVLGYLAGTKPNCAPRPSPTALIAPSGQLLWSLGPPALPTQTAGSSCLAPPATPSPRPTASTCARASTPSTALVDIQTSVAGPSSC